jgi:restriction system protein
MPIPEFQTLMLPILRPFADGSEKTFADIRGPLASEFQLISEELSVNLPRVRQTSFANRVSWAQGYLKQAKLVESVRRCVYRIAPRLWSGERYV